MYFLNVLLLSIAVLFLKNDTNLLKLGTANTASKNFLWFIFFSDVHNLIWRLWYQIEYFYNSKFQPGKSSKKYLRKHTFQAISFYDEKHIAVDILD